MRGVNKVILLGNVGADPTEAETTGGKRIARCSIATNRVITGADGARQEKVDWHRLTFFDPLASIVLSYVDKGDPIYVEGRLHHSQSEDEGGVRRFWTEVIVQELRMLGTKGQGGRAEPPPPADDDDLPF